MDKKKAKNMRETITLYREGAALVTTKEGGIAEKEYEVVEDREDNGDRVITLKRIDRSATVSKVKTLAAAIAKGLGDPRSRTLKGLLQDLLIEYWDEDIDSMYERVVVKGEPVKAREGCFKILIGDGRRKDAGEIMIRE